MKTKSKSPMGTLQRPRKAARMVRTQWFLDWRIDKCVAALAALHAVPPSAILRYALMQHFKRTWDLDPRRIHRNATQDELAGMLKDGYTRAKARRQELMEKRKQHKKPRERLNNRNKVE